MTSAEQDDLSPAAIMAAHVAVNSSALWCRRCSGGGPGRAWPCEPYRLAQALSQAQSELERIASHTRDAYDQRDAAQEALAASEAKVARVEALADVHREGYLIRIALADSPPSPCPRETPFKSYTEPTCSRPEGHAGGCLFRSHDGRTPLEVMPK